eukprot:364358-Chlamydomonas_euryale.AAC.11
MLSASQWCDRLHGCCLPLSGCPLHTPPAASSADPSGCPLQTPPTASSADPSPPPSLSSTQPVAEQAHRAHARTLPTCLLAESCTPARVHEGHGTRGSARPSVPSRWRPPGCCHVAVPGYDGSKPHALRVAGGGWAVVGRWLGSGWDPLGPE